METSESGLRRVPEQRSGSPRTSGTPRRASVTEPAASKRVRFYKSGDPQFGGLRMVVNNRTFKTFEALLDSLSKKVPLAFGVRNITTPRGVHAINALDELEDGKSYICSDRRKVKPVDLALAGKKLAPWYHARPVSSRGRGFPGRREPLLAHAPKRLVVFRNGEPSVKRTLVLQKRSAATFEWILEYLSEVMRFHVLKLHTADGRRVEGLPSLILCSGVVVASGKEPFRPADYGAQKSPGSTRPTGNRMSVRRLKALNRKKKSLSYGSKSRNFSTSSERYIVKKIHNSLMESSCDMPSNRTDSAEYESGHAAAQTEGEGLDGEGLDCARPDQDDIEKSFRVNQDGSMTVEMRVRLTVKEEETLHWTTTLTRSSAANQLEPGSEQDVRLAAPDSRDPVSSDDAVNKDGSKDRHDGDPPSPGNGFISQSSYEEDAVKIRETSPRGSPTPGETHIEKRRASAESIASTGSYSDRGNAENGSPTEQYCVVRQSGARPIPKPRRLSSIDANNFNNTNASSYKSAEITPVESSGEEITETVLHIYEQQTCQDNYNANVGSFYGPDTSGTGHLRKGDDVASAASRSVSVWDAKTELVAADFPPRRHGRVKAPRRAVKPAKGKGKQPRPMTRRSPEGRNKEPRHLLSPVKRPRENVPGDTKKRKKARPFSSAGIIRRIYGNKFKPTKSPTKLKRKQTKRAEGNAGAKSAKPPDTYKRTLGHQNAQKARGLVTWQTSAYPNKHRHVGEQMSLPAFDSSSSVANEYVQNWLKKAQATRPLKTNGTDVSGSNHAAASENGRELTMQTSPEDGREISVKDRIRSLENKMAPSNQQTNGEGIRSRPKSNEQVPPGSQTGNPAGLQGPSTVLSIEPPEEERAEEADPEHHVACNPKCVQQPATTQTSDNHQPSAQDLTHAQHVIRRTQLLEAEVSKEREILSRSTSIRRAPLVSNVSLERKMSLRKSCIDIFTISNDEEQHRSPLDLKSSSSASPKSLESEERLSSLSMPSSEVPTSPNNPPLRRSKITEAPNLPSANTSEIPERSRSLQRHPAVKKSTPNVSPLPKKRQTLSRSELSKRSARSKSMDLPSPPVRRKSKGGMLSRNSSSDSEAADTEKPRSQRKQMDSLQATNASICIVDDARFTDELQQEHQENCTSDARAKAMLANMTERPSAESILQSIRCSIKSIRDVTHGPSSLEKSNSVEDFSSSVVLTTGSPSKVLLTFLSTVALKDSVGIRDADLGDVSCAEALRMIDSLSEIASVRDSRRFEESLSALWESASRQMLESWRDFRALRDKTQEERAIDELIEGLDIPEILKEELVSLSAGSVGVSQAKLKTYSKDCSSATEERDESAYNDEGRQKPKSDHRSHSGVEPFFMEQYVDRAQGRDCYVEVNSSREASSERERWETEGKTASQDEGQPEVEDKGWNVAVEERHSSGLDKENEEELGNKTQDIANYKRQMCDPDPDGERLGENPSGSDEHAESSAFEYEQTQSSAEEELSFYEKASGPEEERRAPATAAKRDKAEVAKDPSEQDTPQPVALRVSLLEKQVADARKTSHDKNGAKKVSLLSQESAEAFRQCSRSAPQSSLSFSYESGGVVTVAPEGNRVKSIRQIFLAKTFTDNAKQDPDAAPPPETAGSGGCQTPTSGERSSGEEDPARKSISKGFVRRTIERLYGKSGAAGRPPSAPGTKTKPSAVFLPFHAARCKAASGLSYFNPGDAPGALTEATRCVAFNAQVGPGHGVPIDRGRWLVRETALIRKSVSDPTGINKNLTDPDRPGREGAPEDTPYSLFCSASEPEERKTSKRCTYLSLARTGDSESLRDPAGAAEAEGKSGPQKNGSAAAGTADNKVHPLADGEAVVLAQPGKGDGAVSRSLPEPDVLDVLYRFCGENCPIL